MNTNALAPKRERKHNLSRIRIATCDNCDNMILKSDYNGNHRWCSLMSQYIPDNEHAPSCDFHKFNIIRKGGMR